MKIAFLVTRLEKPSARYRVSQYIPFLEKKGFTPTVCIIPKNHWDRIKLFRKMRDYDAVFLQKKLFNVLEFNVLRKNSDMLVYDFDDAVMFRDSTKKNLISYKRRKNFIRTVKNADAVIAGNEYLKNFAVKENPKTYVIPTAIDINRYTLRPSADVSDTLNIGWIGSSTTLFYLENMKSLWDAVFDKFPYVKLKIVANKFFDCDRIPVVKKLWKYEEEIDDLHTFDIGLMPLTDDPWARGKCGLKLLQYMAVGIPVVCSPIGVNSEIVTDGINGFWAEDEKEWLEKISILIQNASLRTEIGLRARDTVSKYYSTEITSKKIKEIINSLKH